MAKAATQARTLPQADDPTPHENDIISDVLGVVQMLYPQIPPEIVAETKRISKKRWRGDSPYIPGLFDVERKARDEAIRRDYRNGERIHLLVRRYELTERRIWQILAVKVPVPA